MGEDEVIDVIAGLKAVASGSGATKTGGSLVHNVLDPTTKEMGQELLEWYRRKRRDNVARVAAKADRKLDRPENRTHSLALKVFQEILEGAAVADDELAAEYFGGVLASSLSGVDRDDRGATHARIVRQLSVYQLLTHYLIYSQIKRIYNGQPCELNTADGCDHLRILIPKESYSAGLALTEKEDFNIILSHSLYGLNQLDLIDGNVFAGDREDLTKNFPDAPCGGAVFGPSAFGAELFLSAHGYGHIPTNRFLDPEIDFPAPDAPTATRMSPASIGSIVPIGAGKEQLANGQHLIQTPDTTDCI